MFSSRKITSVIETVTEYDDNGRIYRETTTETRDAPSYVDCDTTTCSCDSSSELDSRLNFTEVIAAAASLVAFAASCVTLYKTLRWKV